MADTFPSTPLDYHSIGGPVEPDTFKSPRQKMWGIFIKTPGYETADQEYWHLVVLTNSMTEIRNDFNEFLRNPPTANANASSGVFIGMDAIIVCEIIPADFVSKIGAL